MCAPLVTAAQFDGQSPATAALSAKHIAALSPVSPTGFYWMDPDGPSAANAVQMFADMDTNGGGWTLAIVSLDASPVAAFAINQNTGSVSLAASHTRKVDNLAELRDAQIRYVVSGSGGTVFDGTYLGRFSDATPAFALSIDTLGLNGQLDASFDFHAPSSDFDVAVYVREVVTPDPIVVTGPFCDDADGSLASCPCANPGSSGTGCDISQGTGGVGLSIVSQETFPLNRVTWSGAGFPTTSTPTSIVIRATGLDSAAPVVFGDGLRCIGTPLVRLAATFASGGTATHMHGHGAGAGSGTFYYQLWFRNTPIMFCDPSAAFNLSNGGTLTW